MNDRLKRLEDAMLLALYTQQESGNSTHTMEQLAEAAQHDAKKAMDVLEPGWNTPKVENQLANLLRPASPMTMMEADIQRIRREAKANCAPGSAIEVCPACGGTGKMPKIHYFGYRITCPDCGGKGEKPC